MESERDRAADQNRPQDHRTGFAMFGVLVLVVVFTLLGVGALTLSHRDNQSSGSILDIKSRQSAAYAGLAFALGEFQRDPANFVSLLEAWRTKSVYGTLTNPLPRLYLKFDLAGGAVTFTKTKPAAFSIPGTPYKVIVELAGIQVPATNAQDPVIVLRSTGSGRSGDEQTVIGAYRVGNVRLNVQSASLGITHPFYLNGTGTWNNTIEASGGDVFFGNKTHMNSTAQKLIIANGGLRVYGDLTWDVGNEFDIAENSWVTGNVTVKDVSGQMLFRKNLVVGGNLAYSMTAQLDVGGSMTVSGSSGIELHGGTLNVGALVANSQLLVDGGITEDLTGGGAINVVGKAYLKQIGDGTKSWTLNASRLELSDNAALSQKFLGKGTWGRLVARSSAASSFLKPSMVGGITISRDSWLENSLNLDLGTAFYKFTQGAGSKVYYAPFGACWGCSGITSSVASAPVASDSISTVAYSGDGVNAQRFDAKYPPKALADLGYGSAPTSESEIGFDITKDPSIETRAFTPGNSGTNCDDAAKICGAYLNQVAALPANSSCFYNGFFVVKIDGTRGFAWDAGKVQTTPLSGKFLFIVTGALISANPWPTTATNADPNNPTNVQFIYVKSTGTIFASFCPRYKNNTTDAVSFFGYVRVDDPGASRSWDLSVPVDFQGAVHVLGDRTKIVLNMNSSSTGSAKFNLNQGVLSAIGTAFGTVFTNPATGAPLVDPALAGFKALENWIAFTPISELR